MTFNELIEKIAARAKTLADLKMDELRACHPESTDTRSQLITFCKKERLSRGEIIQEILDDEFRLEFDHDIDPS